MKRVVILKTIRAEDTVLGAGATILLAYASPPIVKLLREKYLEDNSCLIGDVEGLFKCSGSGLNPDSRYFQP